MSDNNVQITARGIKNSLKKYASLKSICEYVWNGFDAKATQVVIEVSENILGNISFIKVVDNGYSVLIAFDNILCGIQIHGHNCMLCRNFSAIQEMLYVITVSDAK